MSHGIKQLFDFEMRCFSMSEPVITHYLIQCALLFPCWLAAFSRVGVHVNDCEARFLPVLPGNFAVQPRPLQCAHIILPLSPTLVLLYHRVCLWCGMIELSPFKKNVCRRTTSKCSALLL